MKISVAMCTYNGEPYLLEQLESIAAQTRPPDELVVCDDQSADATCHIVAKFAATAPFPVHLHVNPQNLGSTKNFEQAIRFAAGDVIALSDQDDVWLAGKLKRLESEFLRDPHIGLVFTDAEVINENGRPAGYSLWQKLPLDRDERERIIGGRAFDNLLQGSTVTGATMAFRAGFRDLVLPIPVGLPVIHDAWIALLVAAVARVLPVDESLIKYRKHGDQQVGAKERMTDYGDGLEGIQKALQRTTSYHEMIVIGTEVRRRLLEHRNIYQSDDAVSTLEARLDHLRTRASLPKSRLGRLGPVLRELLTMRYYRYSNGIFSAIKDLVS